MGEENVGSHCYHQSPTLQKQVYLFLQGIFVMAELSLQGLREHQQRDDQIQQGQDIARKGSNECTPG